MSAGTERHPGDRIAGRFRLDRPLRVGSAPEAWSAIDEHGAPVTLFYYPDAATSEPVARALLAEAPLVQGVAHARLLAIDVVGIDDRGGAYAACAALEGESLAARLDGVGALGYAEAGTVLCDALQGLSALHERGLTHGGITSAEVVLARDAGGVLRGRLLADGLVGALIQQVTRRSGQGRGKVYGSAHHMAPEQCRGEPTLPETDVWSMGVVLHEALVASPPFDGESALEVIASVLSDEPAPLDDRIPGPVADVVRQSLTKRAGDRPPDAESMCLSLSVALKTVRESQVARVTAKPTPARLQMPGLARGQAGVLPADDLDSLISSVKAEHTPATSFDLTFDAAPSLQAPPLSEALPELDFHTVVGPNAPAQTPPPASSASIPGPMLPPPPQAPVVARPAAPDPMAAFAQLDAAPAPPKPAVPARESQVHTSLSVDTIDRTHAPIMRRPKAINPYAAFLAVAVVTGGLAYGGWRLSGAGDTPPPPPREPTERTPRRSARATGDAAAPNEPDEAGSGDTEAPADPNAPRPEPQTPAEFGVQLSVPLPEGLANDAAIQFVRHVAGASAPDRATARGFVSCTSAAVYLHGGGLDPALRVASVATRCDASDLALVPDVDGDEKADVVAIDARGDGIVLVGSRNLRAGRRVTIDGALAVVGGLTRTERRRTEPVVVVYAQPQGQGGSLVAVGARSGRVVWRTVSGFAPAAPKDYGLTVGPDADRDGTPDIAVGLLRDGHRCVTLLSGATGEIRWPSPRCFESASSQWLALGPDLNGDGRAELSVANTTDGRVRILSGEDGRELRVINPTEPAEGMVFGLSAALVPDLARDGFADVVLGRTQSDGASVEVYSANDVHRIGARRVASREPSGVAAVRVDYLEGFAFEGSRSLLVATTGGVQVLAAAARPEVRDQSASP
jgi:serine/threonine protein kinase